MRKVVNDDMLVLGVGAVTDRAQSIQCRNAESRSKIAVAASAYGSFCQGEAKLICTLIGKREQAGRLYRPLHRRTVQSAVCFQLDSRQFWLGPVDGCLHPLCLCHAGNADIDVQPRLFGDDVGPAAPEAIPTLTVVPLA